MVNILPTSSCGVVWHPDQTVKLTPVIWSNVPTSSGAVAFTFFETTVSTVTKAIANELGESYRMTERTTGFELPNQTYRAENFQAQIWPLQTDTSKSVFFPNLSDGWHSLIKHIGPKFDRCVSVRMAHPETTWPICDIRIYEQGALRRCLYVMKDTSGWVFFEQNAPMGFEHVDAYQNRRVSDRFTPEMVKHYCDEMSFEIDNPLSWRPGGSFVSGLMLS